MIVRVKDESCQSASVAVSIWFDLFEDCNTCHQVLFVAVENARRFRVAGSTVVHFIIESNRIAMIL